jgi:Fe2+ or Zn2+ uptake regulation protein
MPYEEILERFKAQLKIMNLKVTRERLMILEEVMKRKDHFDADQTQSDLFFS